MKNINEIDLNKGLEVQNFVKEIIKEEQESEVKEVEYDENDLYMYAESTECCMEDLEQGVTYDFCIEDNDGNVHEVYCGSKCFLREFNLKNRFNDDWTNITKEQFDLISENC